MAAARTVWFSGRSWTVKASTEPVGPGPNLFSDSPDNVRVDSLGHLHLRIARRAGNWWTSEVILDSSLGYGRYRFRLASAVSRFDPAVVLGLFIYGEDPGYHHREIDIEFGRWSDAPLANARYTVQPRSAHVFVQSNAAPTTHEFTWTPGSVSFLSRATDGGPVRRWTRRDARVPTPEDERARMNLWLQGGRPPADGAEVHVVVSEFSFLTA